MPHLIVGTAGHIDHGKSSVVKALTGTDPDRLMEEKLRGITIDLGFAHLDLGDAHIGIVDVPGHERFVKNMLAGVGGIDLVLLVVAADESIMPQTREHLDICRLLGIQAGIVAITKIDIVEPELVELVQEEVRELVRGTFLEEAPVVPLSSRTGEGVPALKNALRDLASAVPQRPSTRLLRLPVDRVFSMRGFGTVVTGTLLSGSLHKDEEVELIPGALVARVRGIQVHGRFVDSAVAGQRTAVNLQGVDVPQVKRGMVLTVPRFFCETRIVDVRLDLLPASRPLKNLVKVRLHIGTAEVLARVAFLGQDPPAPGASGYAQLRLDAPTFCLCGDPFIVRQFSPAITIGGGRILHPRPLKHKTTDKETLAALQALDRSDLAASIPLLVAAQTRRAVDLRELDSLLGLPEPDLTQLALSLAAQGRLALVHAPAPILLLPGVVASLKDQTTSRIAEFHGQNPLQKGIPREELRKKVFHDLPLEVFRFCLDCLAAERRISLHEETVSLYGREVELSARGEATKARIKDLYRQAGHQPPLMSELISSMGGDLQEIRQIYFWLIKEKILIKISDELAYNPSILEEIKERLRAAYPPGVRFGVAQFKDLFGLTRKHAIPLLEYLDRERITRREGNDRIVL